MENDTGNGDGGYTRGNNPGSRSTQFGGENANPQYQELGLPHPKSIRNSTRYFMGIEIDGDVIGLPKRATPAQKIAARSINAALRAVTISDVVSITSYLTEQVDGKLAQTNLNADMSRIASMSDDEIDRELDAIRAQIARIDERDAEAPTSLEAANADDKIGGNSASGDADGA